MIAINFNWSTWPWIIVQWESSGTKLPKPPLTHSISHSTSPYTAAIIFFFLYFSWMFTLLKIIKHSMPKMLSIPSSILKSLHKNSPVLMFLNASWYDSCHKTVYQNCFKWSWRQLSTTRGILQNNNKQQKRTLWSTQCITLNHLLVKILDSWRTGYLWWTFD